MIGSFQPNTAVAPHVGAWIEIGVGCTPAGSRGTVAPHVGAWIEMIMSYPFKYPNLVAPHVGAWIEMGNES